MVAGASRYANAAAYANATGGSAAAAGSLLSGSGGLDSSLLNVGRRLAPEGVGISGNARALNAQQIQNSAGTFNQLFSVGASQLNSTEAMQTKIAALRSTSSTSNLSRSVIAEELELDVSNSRAIEALRGRVVDTEA